MKRISNYKKRVNYMTKFYIQQESCGVDIEKMQKKSTPAEQQQFVEK